MCTRYFLHTHDPEVNVLWMTKWRMTQSDVPVCHRAVGTFGNSLDSSVTLEMKACWMREYCSTCRAGQTFRWVIGETYEGELVTSIGALSRPSLHILFSFRLPLPPYALVQHLCTHKPCPYSHVWAITSWGKSVQHQIENCLHDYSCFFPCFPPSLSLDTRMMFASRCPSRLRLCWLALPCSRGSPIVVFVFVVHDCCRSAAGCSKAVQGLNWGACINHVHDMVFSRVELAGQSGVLVEF